MSFFRKLFSGGATPPKVNVMSNDAGLIETERPLAEMSPQQREGHYSSPPAHMLEEGKTYTAVVRTNVGEMKFQLFANKAPMTVNNFVYLALQGYYDGTIFHRVIGDFMVQGGDPSGTGRGGPGYKFKDEFDRNLKFNSKGLLAMANAGPGTNGSQFFITHVPTPHLNNRHTIFGQLIDGEEALFSIRERDPMRSSAPADKIERVDIYIS